MFKQAVFKALFGGEDSQVGLNAWELLYIPIPVAWVAGASFGKGRYPHAAETALEDDMSTRPSNMPKDAVVVALCAGSYQSD